MKQYIKPIMKTYDMEPTNILRGSIKVKSSVGISSFFTDEEDTDNTDEKSKYKFWE